MATFANPFVWGTGRRKTAVARVRIKEGTGVYQVNGLEVDAYFLEIAQRTDVRVPLLTTEMSGRVDAHCASGGIFVSLPFLQLAKAESCPQPPPFSRSKRCRA